MSVHSLKWDDVTRAAPLPKQQRRAAIVEATIPLLRQHGHTLTTRQIAEAAGVAEGTLFRAFDSLQDLIRASVEEVLSAEHLRRNMAQAHFTGTLQEDCRAAVELVTGYVQSTKTVFHLGHSNPGSGIIQCAREQLHQRQDELFAFLDEKFAPHADELALEPGQFAKLLTLLTVGVESQLSPHVDGFGPAEIADFALHGASRKELL